MLEKIYNFIIFSQVKHGWQPHRRGAVSPHGGNVTGEHFRSNCEAATMGTKTDRADYAAVLDHVIRHHR